MQTSVSPLLSRKIANIGIVCAVLVVVDHSIIAAPSGSLSWWFMQCLSKGLCQIAVPFFFCVSGFLLAGHINEDGWWKSEVIKRVKSLLVPFVIWGALGSLCLALCMSQSQMESGWCVLKYIGLYPFSLPTVAPLWFVRSLMLLVVLSPFLFWSVRRFRWLTLVFWFGLSIALSVALKNWPDWNNFCGNFIPLKWGCFWFSLGAFLREHPMTFRSRILDLTCLVIGLGLVGFSKYLILRGVAYVPLFQKLSIPFLLAGVWGCFPDLHWKKYVISLAFPIYLVHLLLIAVTRQVFPATGFGGYFLNMGSGLLGSVLLAVLIRKSSTLSDLCFGGR